METYCVSCKKNAAKTVKTKPKHINAFIKRCYLCQEKVDFY